MFEPLGMMDTFFTVPDEKLGRIAVVYGAGPTGGFARVDWADTGYGTRPAFFSGGSGLFSTAPDYLRFAQML